MKQLKKGFPEYLMKIEWTHEFINGYKLDKVALYNETVVSETEVRSWIEQGILDFEDKPTVVVMTKQQYENLFDHVSVVEDTIINDEFYDDLRVEQQGGIH